MMLLDSVIPTVTNWGQAFLVSITGALMALLAFLPAIVGALILLAIGWWLASVIARVVEQLLNRVGFEHAAERTGITGFISRTGSGTIRASHVIALLVKWFIRLIFLELAAQALRLTAVTALLNSIVLFIPNLVVALIIVLVGVLAAQFIGRLLRGSLSQAGFGNAGVLSTVAEYGIIALAVITALTQIGIASVIVTILFAGVVFGLALAAGLAFGLGGRETAAEIWQQTYESSQQPVRQVGQGSGGGNGGTGEGGVRRPQGDGQPAYRQTAPTSMSGAGWRTLVSVKLQEARQSVPDSPEGQRIMRTIDDAIARLERPMQNQAVEVSHRPTL